MRRCFHSHKGSSRSLFQPLHFKDGANNAMQNPVIIQWYNLLESIIDFWAKAMEGIKHYLKFCQQLRI